MSCSSTGSSTKNTLEGHTRDLYPYLVEKAKNREVVSYEKCTDYLETSGSYLGRVLGTINECEHRQNNPLLTAVVVRDEKRDGEVHPSLGFFAWPCVPDEVQVHPDRKGQPSEKQLDFWEAERDRVWSTWAGQ